MNDGSVGEPQPALIPRQGLFSGQRKLFFAIALLAVALGYFAVNAFQGAAMFYLSDLAVARDRVVSSGFWNKAWGLPLYFGGQLFLAASIGG